MKQLASLALLILGLVLIGLGADASDSILSDFSRLFTGAPTNKTIWLLLGGAILAAVGAVGISRRAKSS